MINVTPEQEARVNIDRLLEQAGWSVQDAAAVNLYASSGVAVREFPLKLGHGTADCLLYVNQKAAVVVEAKLHPYRRRSPVREVQHWLARQPSRPPAPPGTGRRSVPPLLPWLDGRNSPHTSGTYNGIEELGGPTTRYNMLWD